MFISDLYPLSQLNLDEETIMNKRFRVRTKMCDHVNVICECDFFQF